MDTFKFTVCAKTAVQILNMAEIILLSAIQAFARLSWKAKNGL
jgi:hypothetical protein